MKTFVQVRHNFESAHRLYLTPGKCASLHGHSFWANVKLSSIGDLDEKGILVEFGELKVVVRSLLDYSFDHGTILNKDDPLAAALASYGKVNTLDGDPSTENIATFIHQQLERLLPALKGYEHVDTLEVYVQETHVNGAGFYD